MNVSKNTRGIQESDVWAAADALIAQGVRPTIERVRQHIGRGSPNTVSPMLEAWFARLGERLGVAEKGVVHDAVPAPVLEIAQQLWQASLEQAQAAAAAALQQREQAAAALEATLAANEAHMVQREDALQQQKKAMDEALKLARSQAQDLSRRLDEMQQLLQEREAQLQGLRQELQEAARQREQERERHGEELQSAGLERQRLAEQFAGNERRMLADLDRARQDLAQGKKQQQEGERKAAQRYEELHQRFVQSEEDLVQARNLQITAQQALQAAQAHVADLRGLLNAAPATAAGQGGATELRGVRAGRSLQRRALSQRALKLPRK